MIGGDRGSLRVALVDHAFGSGGHSDRLTANLAGALHAAGHRPSVLSAKPGSSRASEHWLPVVRCRGLPEAPLRRRGFAVPLMHLPSTVAALVSGGYDVAHAVSPTDAVAALAWRRMGGRPVAFASAEPPRRECLADRRLRLWLLTRAVEDSDAVVAPTDAVRKALWRWLAIDVPLLDPRDAAAHERLYRGLIQARGQ